MNLKLCNKINFCFTNFSNLMTIAEVYKILERRVSIRLNFLLFSVCYVECVRYLMISTKKLFSTNWKNVTFYDSTCLNNFEIRAIL